MKTFQEFVTLLNERHDTDPNHVLTLHKTHDKTSSGHTVIGVTTFGPGHKSAGGKGSNILKHKNEGPNAGKYFAAGGSTNRIIKSTTFHNTPEEAAAHYHR